MSDAPENPDPDVDADEESYRRETAVGHVLQAERPVTDREIMSVLPDRYPDDAESEHIRITEGDVDWENTQSVTVRPEYLREILGWWNEHHAEFEYLPDGTFERVRHVAGKALADDEQLALEDEDYEAVKTALRLAAADAVTGTYWIPEGVEDDENADGDTNQNRIRPDRSDRRTGEDLEPGDELEVEFPNRTVVTEVTEVDNSE